MNARIQLMEFVESLETSDGIFKQSVLEGIEAMEHTEQEPDKSGIRRISNTKWAYTKTDKSISIGYDGINVALDEETKEELMGNFKPPVYIKNLDSLFFGGNLIISQYGRVSMPNGIELFIPRDNIPEEIKGSIFIVKDDKKHNFISIRDRGNGEYQWAYLFGEWAPSAGTEQTETGVRLFLTKRGNLVAELILPELTKRENIESKDEFFTDPRDNKKYRVVKIGSQTWMADNLNWDGAGVTYENKKSNGKKYGRLYKWDEAMKSAPPGWHLPTDAEWQELVDFAGGNENAAIALKSEEWDGDDRHGFSALPGGYRGRHGDFNDIGDDGDWWSATEKDSERAYYRGMLSGDAEVYRYDYYKDTSFSVRLVKD
jgi:uncharacterized protein (TIGR02145 family)